MGAIPSVSLAQVFGDRKELEILEDHGPEWKYDDARFIEGVIREPDAIFEGLERPEHETSLCYSARLESDPDSEATLNPRYGFVFVVFARPGVGGYVVFDWEWRGEDFDHPGHPLDWTATFRSRTWHRT